MSDVNPTPAEVRKQWIKMRRLEILATLAEWRRQWHVEGISRPIGERATLEAEEAALALEERQLGAIAVAEKVERRKRIDASVLAQLTRDLEAAGLGYMVARARERAQAAIDGEASK